ncbi:MAG: hypothetical protein JJU29_06075 [Verrucomicrobia bacterium]|nr:hypothetical protein [Verrucomicrobiota bacterium]
MIPYFQKNTPLTIAMWDFSWLQSHHPGGAFYDLERCVAEAAERGYNTLRVDVFPHYYLKGAHTFPERGANRRVTSWGFVRQPGGLTVDVRAKVIELANLCRKYGIWLGLDTWKSFEVLGSELIPHEKEESVCRAWADTWVKALRLMREDGVLERAVWVAPLNEVPIFLGNLLQRVRESSEELKEIGDGRIRYLRTEHDALYKDLNLWLGEAVKAEIARDEIPLLYSGVWVENYPDRVPAIYDAVDAHFMPDAQLTDADRVALDQAGPGGSNFIMHAQQEQLDLALFGAAWERACRRNYAAMLTHARQFCEMTHRSLTLPGGHRFAVICTEAYGPCNHPDLPEVDWTWYKRYNADAARIFAQFPWSGLTLSNHAEPIFSLWQDADWHYQSNHYILTQTFLE